MASRVLVVDDSQSVRLAARAVLSAVGYEVVEAGDGREALSRLDAAGPVRLVFTDLNMPALDGVNLIRAIRAHPVHRYLPVVIVTTESQESRKQEARAAGATGWIVKPFTPEQLTAVARKLLGAGGAQ